MRFKSKKKLLKKKKSKKFKQFGNGGKLTDNNNLMDQTCENQINNGLISHCCIPQKLLQEYDDVYKEDPSEYTNGYNILINLPYNFCVKSPNELNCTMSSKCNKCNTSIIQDNQVIKKTIDTINKMNSVGKQKEEEDILRSQICFSRKALDMTNIFEYPENY